MITAIIADDEVHARERLRDLLDRFETFEIVAEACDGNEALQMIIAHKPDVAFLDINMPGISVFQSLASLHNPPMIVFQTAYSQHAADAFAIDALDYLLKPIRPERLEKTVAKIRERWTSRASALDKPVDQSTPAVEQVTVTIAGKTRLIPVKEVVRISFEGGFCHIYTTGERVISDKFLTYYEEKLGEEQFFRVSRTDIVNLHHIAMIHKVYQGMYTIELKNGMRIDLSRRRAQMLKKSIDF